MYLHRLNKESLIELGKQGYKVVVCKDGDDQLDIYNRLKNTGRCARAALVKNKEGNKILIVVTKEKENHATSNTL